MRCRGGNQLWLFLDANVAMRVESFTPTVRKVHVQRLEPSMCTSGEPYLVSKSLHENLWSSETFIMAGVSCGPSLSTIPLAKTYDMSPPDRRRTGK